MNFSLRDCHDHKNANLFRPQAIINDTYAEVKSELDEQESDFEIRLVEVPS